MKANIAFDIKKQFFDSKAAIAQLTKNERRYLVRAGSYIRKIARHSIRKPTKKRKVSEPGNPPLNQTGTLKNNIFFGYDSKKRSVVVGGQKVKSGGAKILQTLEYGSKDQKARPFMRPALEKSQPKLQEIWRQTMKK